jgi:hypothetical protein
MIDLAIKKAYFQAITDVITTPVYDAFSIPETVKYPYIIISGIDVNEVLNTSCKTWNVNVTLDIVTGFNSPKGHDSAYEIGGQIEDIINPDNRNPIAVEGYSIGQTRLIGSTPLQLRTNNHWIYRNIRVYSHIVWKSQNES